MIDPPPSQSLYLLCGSGPVFVNLHRPAAGDERPAVIFCPPFGWEEVCSYRSLRFWATELAAAGHAALRVSLPGTGDSAGHPQDPGLIGHWVDTIGTGATWLRERVGARRIVGVGIGMGGLVLSLAAAGGAPIDDLALWATPARGRRILRELSTFAELERAQIYPDAAPAPAPGLESGGFLLSEESRAAIAAIDLRTVTFPAADRRHALLLDRDGMAFDDALRQRLVEQGLTVTDAPGNGFGEMVSHPQRTRPPLQVINCLTEWMAALPAVSVVPRSVKQSQNHARPAAQSSCELDAEPDGPSLRETAVFIPRRHGRLAAILCEPHEGATADTAVILLNAGAIRRIGPSRMWVEAARRWAAQGVATLRLDAEGLGDSDGDETAYRADAALYAPQFAPQVLSAMDFLQRRGVADRFVVGGLCAGASWALHAALLDARVCGLLLLNPRLLIWSSDLGPARDLRALLTRRTSLARIRRQARGARLYAFLRWAARSPVRRLRPSANSSLELREREMLAGIENLSASGRTLLWIFSDEEPLDAELTRSGFLPALAATAGVSVEHIPVRDHTIRPIWAQQEVHRALDRALASALADVDLCRR